MNKEVSVKVKTPVGMTESKSVGPSVTQGTIEAVLMSSNNLDVGVEEAFADETKEVKYKDITLNPTIYMDDLTRMAETVESAQYGNNRMEEMVNRKRLSFNVDKSCYVVMGSTKERNKLRKDILKKPLTLTGEKMKEEKFFKFLGDFIGVDERESGHYTVIKRFD